MPGGFGWEQWLRRSQCGPHFLGSTLPLLLTFVGARVLALGWTLGYVFTSDGVTIASRAGMVSVWVVGLAATGLSAVLLLQMFGRLSGRRWEETSLS